MKTLSMWAVSASAAWSQSRPASPEDTAACLTCGGFFLALMLALFVANIAMLVWVARDAKNRGMDGAVLWMLLVFFTGPVGLVIYLFSRPSGAVVVCSRCGNKKLEASVKCPHCGNA